MVDSCWLKVIFLHLKWLEAFDLTGMPGSSRVHLIQANTSRIKDLLLTLLLTLVTIWPSCWLTLYGFLSSSLSKPSSWPLNSIQFNSDICTRQLMPANEHQVGWPTGRRKKAIDSPLTNFLLPHLLSPESPNKPSNNGGLEVDKNDLNFVVPIKSFW